MKLPYQLVTSREGIPQNLARTLYWMWADIARAHNASVQPRYVELTGNPPATPPEMEQYELIALNCPDWGRRYLVYYDGTVRWYFLITGADVI